MRCSLSFPLKEQLAQDFSNPSAVIFNQGPLKVVSLTVKVDTFLFETNTTELRAAIVASQVPSPFLLTQADLPVAGKAEVALPMATTQPESRCLFIVTYSYYREKDMEKFERRRTFLVQKSKAIDDEAFSVLPERQQMLAAIAKSQRAEPPK